jgi:hypothetical protein
MKRVLFLAFALAGLTLGASAAHANCDQTRISTADADLWNVHGCNSNYFMWQYQAYGVSGSDWGDRGFYAACSPTQQYPKHWSASYLISYGLPNNTTNRTQYHSSDDYQTLARAGGNIYHSANYQAPSDDTSIFGRWTWELFGANKIETSCLLYDPNLASNANPASRAGDFIHEAWHSWLWHNGYYPDHHAGPTGSCTLSGNACDYFYYHNLTDYAFGNLWWYQDQSGAPLFFHSPNQVQVEYLCDVAKSSASWVPLSVRTAAAADANQRLGSRFINGQSMRCYAPVPIIYPIFFVLP